VASFQPPELLPETPRVHRVARGETLRSIAERYDVDVRQLMAWNGLRSEKVRSGQRISLQARGKAAARAVAAKSRGSDAESRAQRVESRAARADSRAHPKTRMAAHPVKAAKPEKLSKAAKLERPEKSTKPAQSSRKAVANDTRGKSAAPARKQQVAAGR
jgi:LysM repeat protein